jgi:hypothetical protein
MRANRMKRWAGPLVAGLIVATQLLTWAPGAVAQSQAGKPIDLRGFATGQPAHATALELGGTRVANAELAWSGSAVDADADGLNDVKTNEMNRVFQPNKNNKLSYARASGVEVGLGTTADDPTTPDDEGLDQVIVAGKAEQDALCSAASADLKCPAAGKNPTEDITNEIAVPADPIAYASAAAGTAHARGNDSLLVPAYCVLGDDLARGTAHVADAQLLDAAGTDTASPKLDGAVLALDDQDPDRSVSNSVSHEKLVPTGLPDNFGLMSEVRQTIAPVTLLAADDNDPTTAVRTVTIEVAGQWVLRAVAKGSPGGASVFYGPGNVSPETPILKIIDSASDPADPATTVLDFQTLFGPTGFTDIDIPGLLTIAIGEDPRAIAKPGVEPDPDSKPVIDTANGTSASAAVDVVRITALDQSASGLLGGDIRIGHMEVSTQVPEGGVNCPIPVTKTADPDHLAITSSPASTDANTSDIAITVHNVYDCDMTNTVLVDHIKQHESDPDFKLLKDGTDPQPDGVTSDGNDVDLPTDNITNADVTWKLGTIAKGHTSTVHLALESATRGGIIRDIANATASFANCNGSDVAGLAIAGLELAGQSAPVDIEIPTAATGPASMSTAVRGAGIAAVALGLALAFRRRRFLRKT